GSVLAGPFYCFIGYENDSARFTPFLAGVVSRVAYRAVTGRRIPPQVRFTTVVFPARPLDSRDSENDGVSPGPAAPRLVALCRDQRPPPGLLRQCDRVNRLHSGSVTDHATGLSSA